MALETGDLAKQVVKHLLEIGYGECSITHEMIAAHEGDLATCEILTGLMFLHEDLRLRDEQRRAAEDELRQAITRLEEQNALAEKLAVELRQAKEVAEAATAAKSDFLAHMSHEIRTPLTALLGFSDLLLQRELNESSRLNYSLIVRRNSEHLLSLINNILDLSKIEAGELATERLNVSLPQLLADVVSLMRVRAIGKELEFELRLLSAIPEEIETDTMRLRQILLNLVGNAIKFTAEGSVRLYVRYMARPVPMLVIDVIDTGIGMSDEQLDRLFEPFQQADSSMSRRYGGSGLGLAICKLLADKLGGDIQAQSAVGEGSTFTLTLEVGVPDDVNMVRSVAETRAPAADAERVSQVYLSGRVLLAEDGPDNQLLIGTMLRQRGLSVVVADNGQIAVDAAEKAAAEGKPFDVILMDMQMPELDGYSATRLLRKKGYRLPIVALTAHAMAGERERCLEAGCDEYLSKPIDRRALLTALAAYTEPATTKDAPRPTPSGTQRIEIVGPASSAMSTARSPIDGEAPLRSTLSDDPEMADLIVRFVASMTECVASIDAARAEGDLDALQQLAHQLKGAGGGYGFAPITEAASALETELRGGARRADVVERLTEELVALCQRVEA